MNDEYDYLNTETEEKTEEQKEAEKKNQKEQKNLDKSTAAADAALKTIVVIKGGKEAGKAYDAAKQTNVGRKVVQTAGKVLNYSSKTNPKMRRSVKTASMLNKVINHGNEVKAEKIDTEANQNSNNSVQNNNSSASSNQSSNSSSSDNSKTDLLRGMFNSKSSSDNSSFDIFGKASKKFNALKLKIYLGIAAVVGVLFIFVFIMAFLDSLMNNFLNLTNWNYGSSSSSENINSDSNYSNDNSSSINTSNLNSLIGEDGINNLTSKINNVGTNCTGMGVASKVVSLIDGLNSYGYKVPYSNNAGDETQLVNSNWGIDENGNTVGFNDITFMNWALRASNIENKVTSINDYKDNALPINLENAKPGDVIIYQNNIYMILQNIGSSVIIAYVAKDGLTYKNYSYNDLKDYDIYNMNLYYVDNCNN